MIEPMRLPERGGVSVVEEALRGLLEERGAWPVFWFVDDGSHAGGGLWAAPRAATPAGADPVLDEDLPPAVVAFAGLLEAGAGHLAAAKAAHVESCRQAAVQARALAAFAACRPAAVLDRPDAAVGAAAAASRAARPAALTAVSEWAVDEVMVALGLSSPAASAVLAEAVTLVGRLPGTLAALEEGVIGPLHARMLVEVLGPVRDEVRGQVEAQLLGRAAGKTVPQLRAVAQRAVLRTDAAAAARRAATAIRERSVRAFPGADGMGSLSATMPVPVLAACRDALHRYAQACAVPGDQRTLDQRMVDCLVDLILRPGETGLPPVQAQLTVVAAVNTLAGGDEPGEIDGQPVPAAMVRELAHALGLLPRPEAAPAENPATDDTQTADGTETVGGTEADADARSETEVDEVPAREPGPGATVDPDCAVDPGEAAAARLAGLLGLRTIAGTALARLPQIAIVEELSGQLLALTSAAGIRRAATCGHPACRTGCRRCTHQPSGPGLGSLPDTLGYSPSKPLGAFVRARDRRCRFPGCRAAAIRCDLDHAMPWPAGPTSADNLCCLCRHHHRLSHQAPGWRMRLLPDGGLEWTTPGGDRITTHPPAYGTDDHPPPKPAPPPPPTLRERVLGRPRRPGDEPAPF
jgi:hypothetical protein